MLKRVLSILLAATLVLALAACGGAASEAPSEAASEAATQAPVASEADEATPSEAPAEAPAGGGKGIDEPITCGITVKMNLEFFHIMADAMEAKLKEYNPDNELVMYVADQDVNKELSNVEDMITQQMDVIFVTCMDMDGSTVALQKIHEAGIVGVVLDSGCTDMEQYAAASITSDNVQAGELAMEALAQAMGGSGKIGVIENTLQATDNERGIGRDNVLANYPDIEIVVRKNTVGLQENAMNAVNDFLQSNPEMDGIWCLGDYAAAGAIAALQAVGLEGEVPVVGVDAAEVALTNIRAGYQIGSAAQFPGEIGVAGVERAIDVLNGGSADFEDIKVPTKWIDMSNIDDFEAGNL